ncbi:MAG: hypothetical protein LBT04_02025 [Prevotellaceae bacterium]|jgi:hypothetical protein|nr:hypothetical protein [Prevotellaceae bacterium]
MHILQFIISLISALFGGGLAVIATLKWESKKAKFVAKSTEIDYSKNVLETQSNYIINPLKEEIKLLRKDMRQLQHAIEKIGNCDYKENCPVLKELRKKGEKPE